MNADHGRRGCRADAEALWLIWFALVTGRFSHRTIIERFFLATSELQFCLHPMLIAHGRGHAALPM